jgi:hypothetical protein
MSLTWIIDRKEIEAALEAHRFDIDSSDASMPEGGGSLSARKDSGEHTIVLKMDSGGRIAITESQILSDQAGEPIEIAEVTLKVTERTSRRRQLRGTIRKLSQLQAILTSLDTPRHRDEPPPV